MSEDGKAARPRRAVTSFFLAAAVLAGLFFTIRGPVSRIIGEQLVGIIWEPAARAIREGDLPAKSRPRILARIHQISAGAEAGSIDREGLYEVATLLSKGPWLRLGRLMAIEDRLLPSSGLSAEEKAELSRGLRRLGALVVGEKISRRSLKGLEQMARDPVTRQLPKSLPDQALRELSAAIHRRADAEEIAADPPDLDLAAEFEERIDRILAEPED